MVAPAHEAGLPRHLALGSRAGNDKAPLDRAVALATARPSCESEGHCARQCNSGRCESLPFLVDGVKGRHPNRCNSCATMVACN
eukprot:14671908-Alexandrium_andersonii.AAC.1